ncbi:MAG: copper amine oxidase N-terminal domain-containing protein [Firmicutes bacterium]|nr:copper amine oxidase N-terminal domain-containing protein [Bacillota bacterium]
MKLSKVLAVAFCVLMLVAVFSSAALADNQEIAIQLDGQNIQVGEVAPIIVDGRTFVPFRALFEAMGAEVDFDDATRTVLAERDGLNISFVIGEKAVTIAEGENKTTVQIDAATFIREGRTLIPVRFAAQALGASVGWDAAKRTVLIIDTDKLAAKYAENFTLMNLILADNAKYYDKTYAFTGNMDMKMKVAADESTTYPMDANVTFDGLVDGVSAMDMNMTMSLAMEQLLSELTAEADEAEQAEINELINGLKNMKVHVLMDMNSGKYYMQSAFLNQMLEQKEDAWLLFDFMELLSDMDMDMGFDMSMLQSVSKVDSMEDALRLLVAMSGPTDVNSYAELVKELNAVETVVGDKAFVKAGDVYTAKTSVKDMEGVDVEMTLVIKTANDAFASYDLDAKLSAEGMTMTVDCDMNAAGKQNFKVAMDAASLLNMEISGSMAYSDTDKKVPAMPTQNVVDIMDLLMGAIIGEGE